MTKLEELKRLNEARTKGEWKSFYFQAGNSCVTIGEWIKGAFQLYGSEGHGCESERAVDAQFIAESANAMDALLAVVRAAQAIIPTIEADCDSTVDQVIAKEAIKEALAALEQP